MSSRHRSRVARAGAVAAFLALSVIPMLSGSAAGEESLSDLEARMDSIQAELDATTVRIEALRAEHEEVGERIHAIEDRRDELLEKRTKLQKRAIERAVELYRNGGTSMMEVLFSSETFTELTTRAELLSEASQADGEVFLHLSRTNAELRDLEAELAAREDQLAATTESLTAESDRLEAQFADVSAEYEELQAAIAAARAREERAEAAAAAAAAPAPADPAPAPDPIEPAVDYSADGAACPVAGPVSFVDSWLAPRVGHLHQGVDMMAAHGTPIVAIVSGTITYAGYGDTSGYWIQLTGDNGNGYWYMHNAQNLVTSGHVDAGQQIATVGDTGNASSTAPHLHFEYHPGGGAAVNPYPLVAGLC